MPRRKSTSDVEVLDAAYGVMHDRGPDALTFAALSAASGLSASTLVQRFKSMDELKQRTLLHAWDRLEAQTAELASSTSRSPQGAIDFLVRLTSNYGDIEAYAEALLILREDLRRPALRARGAAWKASLVSVLDECFASAGTMTPGLGLLMASHWQGSLLWWSFEPAGRVEDYVDRSLRHFVRAMLRREVAVGAEAVSG